MRILKLACLFAGILLIHETTHANSRSYLELDTGYRYDRTYRSDATFTDDGNIVGTNNYLYHNISSYILGARGVWAGPCGLYLKGDGHYGWLQNGDFLRNATINGHLDGHTIDGAGAIGYIFNVCCCFDFVPLIGGSYDALQFTVHRLSGFYSSDTPEILENQKFHAIWTGPFIGFDVLFDIDPCGCFNGLDFDTGYEYHYGWAKVHENYPNDPDNTRVELKTNNVMGHVFHLEGHYPMTNCWFIGARLQYSSWHESSRAKHEPIIADRETFSADYNWRSFEATFNIGFNF